VRYTPIRYTTVRWMHLFVVDGFSGFRVLGGRVGRGVPPNGSASTRLHSPVDH